MNRTDTRRHAIVGAALLGLVALTGCQSAPWNWNDSVRDTMNEDLARADKPAAKTGVPTEVKEGLLPPLEITLPEGRTAPVEPRFDLSVANAPARQVLLGLVEGTPYEIVLHPDVVGNVTLNLKDITVPEAMNALRDVYGYEYRREGNRYFILGRGMQTRIFHVNYLNLVRRGKSDTRVQSGEIGSRTSGTGATSSTTTAALNSIQVETQSQTDFWKDLSETLRVIVGTSGDRRVVVNPQAGIVVVRAMPQELRVVEDYLGVTHANVNRQVVLEAKILEVELNDAFQAGINWSKIHGNYTFGQVGGGSAFGGSGLSEIAGNTGNLNPTTGTFSPISGTNASAFGGIFSIAARTSDFAAFVELLKSQGEVQVLSSPRVSTVNNQKAVIKIGGDEFFVTGVTGGTTTTVGVTSPTVQLTSFFSGIVLDVTPQIDERNNIVLHIHPSVSTITQQDKSFSVFGSKFTLPLAASTIQESDNIVRAQSAQIIVIGGLMKEASTDQNASVPLLGDIPIVGNLFKHRKLTRVKRELVILLKPTIVDTKEWDGELKGVQERMKKIRVGS